MSMRSEVQSVAGSMGQRVPPTITIPIYKAEQISAQNIPV